MKKVDINNSTDENIATATGHSVEYIQRVKGIRKGIMIGDLKLAAIATGFTEHYVHMVICFRRKSEKILQTLELIQENRAQLLRDTPKIVHQLTEDAA